MSALTALADVLPSLIRAIIEALEGGVSHDALLAAIKATMVAASDEQMRRELPP